MQVGTRCFEQWAFKFLQIPRAQAELRELKLQHTQDLSNARSKGDRDNFYAIFSHDSYQETVLNTEELEQCGMRTESFANGIERHRRHLLEACGFGFSWRQLPQGPEELPLSFLCQPLNHYQTLV